MIGIINNILRHSNWTLVLAVLITVNLALRNGVLICIEADGTVKLLFLDECCSHDEHGEELAGHTPSGHDSQEISWHNHEGNCSHETPTLNQVFIRVANQRINIPVIKLSTLWTVEPAKSNLVGREVFSTNNQANPLYSFSTTVLLI